MRQRVVRILLWLASAHFMFHLFFSEGYGLVAHTFGGFPRTVAASLLLHLFLILLFSVWSFPFLSGYAALRFDSGADYFWFNRFRNRNGLWLAVSAFAICAGVLTFQPTFTKLWKQKINVEQEVNLDDGKGSVTLTSNDYLSGTRVSFTMPDGETVDTLLSDWASETELREFTVSGEPWISAERTVVHTSPTDSTTTFDVLLTLHSLHRPYTLTVTYSSSAHVIFQPSSPLAFSTTERTMTFRWYSFPETLKTIPLRFTIARTASVVETVEAIYVEPIVPAIVHNEHAAISYRTRLSRTITLSPPSEP